MVSLYLAGILVAFLIGVYRLLYLLVIVRSVRAANVRLMGFYLNPWDGSFVRKRSSWRVWLGFVLQTLCIEPLLSWINVCWAAWRVFSALINKAVVPENVKQIQYKIANVRLSKEAMRELSDELALALGTTPVGLGDDDPDTLEIPSGDWSVEARFDRSRKQYRLHSHPPDYASIFDSDYEYRIEGARVFERLLNDGVKNFGKIEEHVKDNVVLESATRVLDDELLSRYRREVEWHEVPSSALKYFVLSRHPEVLPRLECRRFLRQELERLRFGVAEQRRKAADIGAELHEENGVYDLRFPEGAGGAEWDSIRKLVTAESLAGVGLTPAEFRNAGSLMASLDRILGSE
jgi:hypothetical protein